MSIGREDRAEMSAMHAVASGTNASTSSLSKKRSYETLISGPWVNKPTIISVPSHPPERSGTTTRSTRVGGNPFSGASFDNLNGRRRKPLEQKATRSNPMSLTVVPTSSRIIPHQVSSSADRGRSAKKRKVEIAPAESSTRLVSTGKKSSLQRRHHIPLNEMSITPAFSELEISSPLSQKYQSSNKDNPGPVRSSTAFQKSGISLPTPSSRPEVIDVDQDEDLGELVHSTAVSDPLTPTFTSDDLQIGSPPHSTIGDILEVGPPSDQHAFNKPPPERTFKPRHVSAPHTTAVKERLNARQHGSHPVENGMHDIGDDPIEDADEFDSILQTRSPRPIPVDKNNVRRMVSEYESLATKPPELDLKAKGKSMIRNMKRKKSDASLFKQLTSGPHLRKPPNAQSLQEDILDYSHSPKSGKNKEDKIHPLEAYACGDHIFSSVDQYSARYWVRMRRDSVAIMLGTENIIFEIGLEQDVREVNFPRPDEVEDFPMMFFTLHRTPKNRELNARLGNAFGDDDMDWVLTIKPLTSHTNGSPAAIKRTMVWFRQMLYSFNILVLFSSTKALIALWEDRQRASNEHPVTTTPPSKMKLRARPDYDEGPQNLTSNTITQSSTSDTRVTRPIRRPTPSSQLRRSPSASPDETILLYPPTGTGAVNVTIGDLKRLEPGEFLNDTLIECGLKLWLNDLRIQRPELADQVHVFSPFFYTQLNQRSLEKGYQSVRKWTSRFDLFKKKYIIVPINEHLHWYLAIICNAERVLQHPSPTKAPVSNVTTRTQGRKSLDTNATAVVPVCLPVTKDVVAPLHSTAADEQEVEQVIGGASGRVSKSDSRASSSRTLQDESVIVDDIIPATSSDEEDAPDILDNSMESNPMSPRLRPAKFQTKTAVPANIFYAKPQQHKAKSNDDKSTIGDEEMDESRDDEMDIDPSIAGGSKLEEPYIFSFDSLSGKHTRAFKVLSQYLEMEANDKKGWIDPLPAVGKKASVPTQPNFCDCGVYLLHFVEQFMLDPEAHFENIMSQNKPKKLTDVSKMERERFWNHQLVAGRRQELKEKILSLSVEWKEEKDPGGKGKGKGKEIEIEPSPAPVENDGGDSDIEVLDMSPEPSRATIRTPKAQKAIRMRG